jgi:hypothetical protein
MYNSRSHQAVHRRLTKTAKEMAARAGHLDIMASNWWMRRVRRLTLPLRLTSSRSARPVRPPWHKVPAVYFVIRRNCRFGSRLCRSSARSPGHGCSTGYNYGRAKKLLRQENAEVIVQGSSWGGQRLCAIANRCNEWNEIPVFAVAPPGTASFHEAIKAGHSVELKQITGITKSLGAKRVCERAVWSTKEHPIHSVVVSDRSAPSTCEHANIPLRFLLI